MCPHVMEEGCRTLWGLFYKDTNPIHKDSAFKPKAPPPNTITLGDQVSTYNFWEDTTIQSVPRNNEIITEATVGYFWNGFEDFLNLLENEKELMMLILKDWLSGEFRDTVSSRFDDQTKAHYLSTQGEMTIEFCLSVA